MAGSQRRTAFLVLVSALLWVGAGSAGTLLFLRGDRDRPPQVDGADIESALTELGLTADQRFQVSAIVRGYRARVLALHAEVEQVEARFWDQVRAAEQAADEAIGSVLTDEQRRRYEEMALGRS